MFLNQSRARLQFLKRRVQEEIQIVGGLKAFARNNLFRNVQSYLPPKTLCNLMPKASGNVTLHPIWTVG